jgi:hypothetical protein
VVCRVGDYTDKECLPFCKERWDADSALIAAAPEMLEALEALTEAMLQAMIEENWGKGMYDGVLRGEAFRTAQSIIAKAKGETP